MRQVYKGEIEEKKSSCLVQLNGCIVHFFNFYVNRPFQKSYDLYQKKQQTIYFISFYILY
ncbi:hypothetical protein D0T90_01380 [Neisseria animalis]|uniref:Uncharacterized protein n=1 Tax=Neisseria animalis TaxID=492 RepID=A0A5P3MP50_NEIAN|nr:hypothetical protein D0T90_01380 [Neisseria animalis]ROW33166.1 hypothetical protein CGZ60_00110 [Neisseria animalis]